MAGKRVTAALRGLAACLALALVTDTASACSDRQPCIVDGGSYLVRPPKGWDGNTRLPAMFFFHGHNDSAETTMADIYMSPPLDAAGVLLVAMDGEKKSWSFPGKLTGERDDFAYVAAVLTDVKRRFPVIETQTLATGFSVGGSMVWHLACRLGDRSGAAFAAYAPMAGAYWDPMPEACPGGAAILRHIHGTADRTVPMAGRTLRNGLFRQGDVGESWRRLLARNGFAEDAARVSTRGELTCRTWSARMCASGRAAEICLHDGGHTIQAQWMVDSLNFLRAQTPQTAAR